MGMLAFGLWGDVSIATRLFYGFGFWPMIKEEMYIFITLRDLASQVMEARIMP